MSLTKQRLAMRQRCEAAPVRRVGGRFRFQSIEFPAYWRDPDRGPARHVSQTAAVLNDPELNLPEFTLQPPMKRPLVV